MQRRALLSALATGTATLAGCAGFQDAGTTTEPTTKDPTTTTPRTTDPSTTEPPDPPDTGLAGATTAVLETGDRTLSLLPGHHDVQSGVRIRAWLSATATADHPAIVTATIENPTTYATGLRTPGLGPLDQTPFASPDRDPGVDAGLYLAPTADHEFAERVPAVARDEGFWYLDERPGRWQPETLELPPCESRVAQYAVVTHVDYPGRLPPARYQFGHGDGPLTLVAWRTTAPGPTDRSRFARGDVPAFEDQRPEWYHDAGPQTPVYLQPSTERAAPPARVTFTLYNHTRAPLTGNRYDWSLYKEVDGEWFHVAPWAIPVPLTPLAPGDTMEWTVHAFTGESVPCDDALDLGYLGGGPYAFHVGMSPKREPTRAARFDLVGPDVEVVPTEDASVESSGETVEVTDPTRDDRPTDVLVLERADSASQRVIPEQVMRPRNHGLRNTLPFFEPGVQRVRLRAAEQTVDEAVRVDEGDRRVGFEGDAFRVSRVD